MAQNWWDAAPVVQPGGPPRGFVYTPPADPNKQAAEVRAERSDARAERADQRAAAAAAREQQKFEREDTMAPPPGNIALTGDAYLATLDPALAGQVKALSEGRRAFPTGSALRSPAMQQLVAAATQYDPTLDAANAATRVATRKDFTSGKSAQNITAINTALGHFGTLWQASKGLGNRSIPAWNAVANVAESATGDPRVNKFNLARNAVVNELERVFRGSGGSEADIAQWRSTINSSMSPDQLRAAIGQGIELLNSRLQAIGQQYNQGMNRSDEPLSLLNHHSQQVFNALANGGNGILPEDDQKGGPPTLGGGPGGGSGGPPQSLATGSTRNVYDPVTASKFNALVHRGASVDQANSILPDGYQPIDPKQWADAVSFAKDHPKWQAVEATRTVPTTVMQRLAASPAAAAITGAGAAATAGLSDVVGRELAGPSWDANRTALASLNPKSDIAGNVAGGIAGFLGGKAILSRVAPSVLPALTARLGRAAAPAGDLAYGGLYGANESPDDPMGGATQGGIAALLGGAAGRGLTRGLAGVIAPSAGEMAPLYERGVFPTIGQRFARSGIAGRAVNTAEQALQSVPFLGSLVSRSRQGARDQFQLGAFNDALGDIGLRLPEGMTPGTEPHAFSQQKFKRAYDAARSGMQFVLDQPYIADHQAFTNTLNNGVLSAPQAQQVQTVISNAVGSRLPRQGGGLTGDAYKAASKDIGSAIDTWSRNPDTAPMAGALRDYQTLFDNAARRNSNPQAVEMLDQADSGYAKLVRIEDAARRVGGDAGTFNPTGFDRSVQNNAGSVRSRSYLRGDALMQDFADAGRGLSDTLPTSGTAERLLTSRAAVGAGALMTGAEHAAMAHPGALAPFALYVPGVDTAVKRALAPNAVRLGALPPNAVAAIDNLGTQINDLAPLLGRITMPGALAYRFGPGQ